MSDNPRPAGPAPARPAPGAGVPAGKPSDDPSAERVVIRDKRKVEQSGKGRPERAEPAESVASGSEATTPPGPAAPETRPDAAAPETRPDAAAPEDPSETGVPAATGKRVTAADTPAATDGPETAPDSRADSGPTAASDLAESARVAAPDATAGKPTAEPAVPAGAAAGAEATEAGAPPGSGALGAELEALRSALEERTQDLQRVSAEYANYRKRVDRDRGLAAEQTIGQVLGALLPVLDDLDRAREHGDLIGPFGAVAEQLAGTLAKFGLTAFGEQGDPFDPTRHEAVTHLKSADVTEPSCIEVMRRGYLLGDRLLRPAMVAVADPEE